MEPTARLLFLGAPRIFYGPNPVQKFESRKALALLGYLAARGDAIPRSQLVALPAAPRPIGISRSPMEPPRSQRQLAAKLMRRH